MDAKTHTYTNPFLTVSCCTIIFSCCFLASLSSTAWVRRSCKESHFAYIHGKRKQCTAHSLTRITFVRRGGHETHIRMLSKDSSVKVLHHTYALITCRSWICLRDTLISDLALSASFCIAIIQRARLSISYTFTISFVCGTCTHTHTHTHSCMRVHTISCLFFFCSESNLVALISN